MSNILRFSFISTFLKFSLLSLVSIMLYELQIHPYESYQGYLSILSAADFKYVAILLVWIFISAIMFPRDIKNPSDVFVTVYIVFLFFFAGIFWPIVGLLDSYDALILLFTLLIPLLTVKLAVRNCRFTIKFPRIFSINYIEKIFIILLLGTLVYGFIIFDFAHLTFDKDYYGRRLLSREVFISNPIYAYFFQISLNSISPFLSFRAGINKKYQLLFFSLIFSFFGFLSCGIKGSLIIIAMLFSLGFLIQFNKWRTLPNYLLVTIIFACFLSLIEFFFREYSIVADFIIRRIGPVVVENQSYFIHSMLNLQASEFFLNGINIGDFPSPEYWVGNFYKGSLITNSNVNCFQHQIATSGILGYIFVIILVATINVILDSIKNSKKTYDAFAVAYIFSYLIVEQAFSIVMISSGIIVMLLILILD